MILVPSDFIIGILFPTEVRTSVNRTVTRIIPFMNKASLVSVALIKFFICLTTFHVDYSYIAWPFATSRHYHLCYQHAD